MESIRAILSITFLNAFVYFGALLRENKSSS